MDRLYRGVSEQITARFGERAQAYLSHAEAVADRVGSLLPEGQLDESAVEIVRTAALLHQAEVLGREGELDVHAITRDLARRVSMAEELIGSTVPGLGDRGISTVTNLISSVDQTFFYFPSASDPGDTIHWNDPLLESEARIRTAIRAADAIEHASKRDISAAVVSWRMSEGMEVGVESATPVPLRGLSVDSNAALLVRRLVLDSVEVLSLEEVIGLATEAELALESAGVRIQRFHQELFEIANVRDARRRLTGRTFSIALRGADDLRRLYAEVRRTSLGENPDLLPYREAHIRSDVVPLDDIVPLARYAIEEQVAFVRFLHDALLGSYLTSLADLRGLLRVRLDGEDAAVAPPIIEVLPPSDLVRTGGRNLGLVDGMHRVMALRSLGYDAIRVVVIADVSLPLVPLPVTWEQVREYPQASPPSEDEKRDFRYPRLADVPVAEYAVEGLVTEQNFRYYFFRNLTHLGSKGRRKFDES